MRDPYKIIGLGSPHGDDQAGWLVVHRLQEIPTFAAQVMAFSNPIDMLGHLDCSKLIVVDAARSDTPLPSVHRFIWPDDRIALEASHSSHGVGVCYVLRMAEQLGQLPEETICYAVSSGTRSSVPNASPSAAVLASVEQATLRIAAEWEQDAKDSPCMNAH